MIIIVFTEAGPWAQTIRLLILESPLCLLKLPLRTELVWVHGAECWALALGKCTPQGQSLACSQWGLVCPPHPRVSCLRSRQAVSRSVAGNTSRITPGTRLPGRVGFQGTGGLVSLSGTVPGTWWTHSAWWVRELGAGGQWLFLLCRSLWALETSPLKAQAWLHAFLVLGNRVYRFRRANLMSFGFQHQSSSLCSLRQSPLLLLLQKTPE